MCVVLRSLGGEELSGRFWGRVCFTKQGFNHIRQTRNKILAGRVNLLL